MCFGNVLPFHPDDEIPSKIDTNNIKFKNEFKGISPSSVCKYYSLQDIKKLSKKKKNLSIFHNNINGLENKFDLFQQSLQNSNFNFDIIAITETSQKESNGNFLVNVDLKGYSLFSTSTNTSKGGTAIYINESFVTQERQDLTIKTNHIESVWVEIKNKRSKNIICGNIYRHPHDMYFQDFLEYLEETLSKISSENKEIYICGDFNIDLLKLDSNTKYKQFYDLMCSYGFAPKILQPSRITENTATLIDNIFTNNLENNVISGNIITDLSDHYSQFITISREKIDFKTIDVYRRDFSSFSIDCFRKDVSEQNFYSNDLDVNAKFGNFYTKLEACVNRHAPLKRASPKKLKLECKPWITQDIQKLIKYRNRLFRKKKKDPNNQNTLRLYKMFRNRVNREIKKNKKQFFNDYFDQYCNDSKKTWDGIKSIININKVKFPNISQLKVNEKIITTQKDIAQELNNFFINVGPNVEKQIPKNPKIKPQHYLTNRNTFELLITHISNEEVIEIIEKLENKSVGPQSIPIKLLKLIPDLIIAPLCDIINQSFITGIFPDSLKLSKVIPIHKEGATDDLNNYRPISLLSIFDKIIEKLMHYRLYNFLQTHNVLFKNQFGFRKNTSTSFALIEIVERIRNSIDNKMHNCGIFIDLRKAFDTINHDILLSKMEHYGIRGITLKWFKSYLQNRKQFVFLNGVCSDIELINCGVPQGSVLGPLLFLIYINDLPNISKKFTFFLFADDTNIFYETNSKLKLEKNVNKELKKLYTWLIVNRLGLNLDKTKFVIFHPYNKPNNLKINLRINKKPIKETQNIKYLGIILDSTLSWKDHTDKISKKIKRAIGLMYKIRPYVFSKTLLKLYYSLIFPHLIYGIESWGTSSTVSIKPLIILQKRAVRLITFKDKRQTDYSLPASNPIFNNLKILKFPDISMLYISRFVFRCLNKLSTEQFHTWFKTTSNTYTYNTRSGTQNNLYLPYARTTNYGQRSIKYHGPKIWNELPIHIKKIETYATFTSMLKHYLLSKYNET